MKAHPQNNTLLKAAKSNAITKAFKRVLFSPPQEEFQNIFFNASKKIKTPNTQALTMQTATSYGHDHRTTEKKHMPITWATRQCGVQCFVGQFVQGSTFVLRMNICGWNPALRVAPNR